ncbi:Sperm-associated antigen 7 [Armadillidium vulgare]|nr:Sperm-associated antigen 7 [Armadillidium vulgare]
MDLLDSIMSKMDRPPVISTQQKKLLKGRDVADVAGLTTHVFGLEEDERWVMAFKKEYPLSEDELNAYRNGVDWDPDKAKEDALQRERQKKEEEERAKKLRKEPVPNNSELKKDKRTIEETLADIKRAKKSKMSQETAKE